MKTQAKLAPATLRALRAADAALAKTSATVQVQFQAFAALVAKTFPAGVKAADLLRTIHGPDAQSKEDGKPTAAYTRAARAVRAAFPATVKARKPAAAGSKGKAGKGKAGKEAQRAAAPSADAIAGWLADVANRAAFVKFARLHADARKLVASIAAEVAAK